MTGHVNHNRAGQDQNVIFPVGDIHTVGVAPGKPLLRDGGPEAGLRLRSGGWGQRSGELLGATEPKLRNWE